MKYLPTEIKIVTPAVVPTVSSVGYFDMGFVSAIHKLCNGEQFQPISELNLYAILNNQLTSSVLKIKSGEKTRMCILSISLASRLRERTKPYGVVICSAKEISESYYSSKYREPASEIPSQKSVQFAKGVEANLLF